MLSILLFGPLARIAPRVLVWSAAAALVVALLLLGIASPVFAADAPGAPTAMAAVPAGALDGALLESVRALALDPAGQPHGTRVEVTIGQLDARLHLAPCRRVEPYLPVGMRLWGKSRIGLRCKEGQTPWNVYLPIVVKVYGRALVVPAGAGAGSVLGEADVAEAEVDLAEEFTAAITDPKLAVGRTLAQAMRPGQTLRQGQLKLRQLFAAGETVRVIASGDGFALESEGQALGVGLEGQVARVRTESGKIVSGLPSGERRIAVAL